MIVKYPEDKWLKSPGLCLLSGSTNEPWRQGISKLFTGENKVEEHIYIYIHSHNIRVKLNFISLSLMCSFRAVRFSHVCSIHWPCGYCSIPQSVILRFYLKTFPRDHVYLLLSGANSARSFRLPLFFCSLRLLPAFPDPGIAQVFASFSCCPCLSAPTCKAHLKCC